MSDLMATHTQCRTRLLSPSSLSRSLSTSKPAPEPSDSETRISNAVTILLHHRSKTRYNHLKSAFGSPFSPPESAQIILHIRSKPRLALRFFNTPLCSRHLSVSSTLIHVLARARLRPETLSLIRSAILSLPGSDNPLTLFNSLAASYRSCDSAPFVFDLLIKSYLQSKNLDRAVQIARILISQQIQPSISTSNALIRFASQCRGPEAGFELYNSLFGEINVRIRVSPNVSTFNVMLLAFYREGRLEMSGRIKNEMVKFGCKANVFTYCILMAGFCDEGMLDEAMKVWVEMKGSGVAPDLMAFNTMIKGFCEAKEMERAEELVREMGLSGVEASGVTYENLIRGYCSVGDADLAMVLWRDAKRKGFRVENEVVEVMIEGLCRRKKVGEGLGVLRVEMKREGFVASRRSYKLLVGGFCEEGEMEMAVKIQAEMAGKGFAADSNVYGDFAEGYRRLGDEEKACRLEREMHEML